MAWAPGPAGASREPHKSPRAPRSLRDGTTGTPGMAPRGPCHGATGREGTSRSPGSFPSAACPNLRLPKRAPGPPAAGWRGGIQLCVNAWHGRPNPVWRAEPAPSRFPPTGDSAAGLWLNAPKHLPGRRPGGPFPTAPSTRAAHYFPFPASPVCSPSQAATWPRGQATMRHHHEGRPNLKLAAGHADCPGEEEKKA